MKTGDFEWTLEYLAKLWEVVRRCPTFIGFCEQHKDSFQDGLLLEEAYLLPEAEHIRQRFGLNLIHHHSARFTPDTIVDALVFQKPFTTKHVYAVEGEDQDVTILTPLTGERFITAEVGLEKGASIPQIVDEIAEWLRSARAVAGIEKRVSQRWRTRAIRVLYRVRYKGGKEKYGLEINTGAHKKQIERELRRLAGAAERPGRARRKGARGSLMAALRFVIQEPETLKAYDLRMMGVGTREIARRLWPDDCRDCTLKPVELIRRHDEEATRLAKRYTQITDKKERARMIERELQKVGEDWLALRVVEERVRKKIIAVKRVISMLDEELWGS